MPDFGRWTSNGGDPSLNEINRTDRFLDALAFEQPVYATDPGEAELINLLSGWRDDIRDAPLTVPVTPRDAVIALDSAQRTRKRSRRTLALVGSTAAAVRCRGGFASVVAGAGPGDSLYGLRTMIFGEQPAARDDAVMLASQQLAEVQQLVDEGQWDAAQQKLQTLTTTVASVNDDVRKQELVTEWQELTVKVDAQDAAAVLPPDVPPPVFPDVPVVVLDTPTSSDNPSSPTATTSPSETTTSSPSETTTSSPTSTPVDLPPPTSIPATTPPPATQSPLPTPSGPLPTPSVVTPLPTPTAATPLPTASVATQSPPPVTTSVVEQQVEELQPTAEEAPPVEAPSVESTVVAPPTQRQAPPVQRQAPVTTTFVVPEPETGSGGEGS
ncbi:MAG: anti-sigma-D factor RsdA [Mycobacterium sp.]